MTTENVMKLDKIEKMTFSFVCSTFLPTNLLTLTVWKECKQAILPMYRTKTKKKQKKKKKINSS